MNNEKWSKSTQEEVLLTMEDFLESSKLEVSGGFYDFAFPHTSDASNKYAGIEKNKVSDSLKRLHDIVYSKQYERLQDGINTLLTSLKNLEAIRSDQLHPLSLKDIRLQAATFRYDIENRVNLAIIKTVDLKPKIKEKLKQDAPIIHSKDHLREKFTEVKAKIEEALKKQNLQTIPRARSNAIVDNAANKTKPTASKGLMNMFRNMFKRSDGPKEPKGTVKPTKSKPSN